MKSSSGRHLIFKYFGIAMAAISLAFSYIFHIEGLSEQAMHTMGVLAGTMFLFVFESFPVSISCLISSVLLFVCECVGSITEAFSGFSNHILYFTIASFGLSLAFQKSVLSRKILSMMLRWGNPGVRGLTFLFMLCAAALSSIMSNVAAVVIFLPYAEQFLAYIKEEERKKSRRGIYICITVSALIGGMITPAGSSMNLICVDMLETYAGVQVRFIDWVIIGLPLAFVMIIAAFFIITTVYPPAEPAEEEMSRYLEDARKARAASFMDIYVGILIAAIVSTWIISSWIPAIHVTAVSVAGLAMMFLPGIQIMTWGEFCSSISWPTFFIAGNLISISEAVTATGLCEYFTEILFAYMSGQAEWLLVAQIAVITFLFMAFLPSAPAVISILSPIIIRFAQEKDVNPVMLLMASALCVSNIYLFPLDAPLAVAYDRKAFRMFELPRATIWIQMFMVIAVSVWIPLVFHFVY